MIEPVLPDEPWQRPLFASDIPVEMILSLARAFCGEPLRGDEGPEQGVLDLTILRMLAVELFKRGADYRELPWVLRLEHVRITGLPEGHPPRRPDTP